MRLAEGTGTALSLIRFAHRVRKGSYRKATTFRDTDTSDLAAGFGKREGFGLDAREINKLAGLVNINAHNVPLSIEINHDTGRDFTDLGPDLRREVDEIGRASCRERVYDDV